MKFWGFSKLILKIWKRKEFNIIHLEIMIKYSKYANSKKKVIKRKRKFISQLLQDHLNQKNYNSIEIPKWIKENLLIISIQIRRKDLKKKETLIGTVELLKTQESHKGLKKVFQIRCLDCWEKYSQSNKLMSCKRNPIKDGSMVKIKRFWNLIQKRKRLGN